jgi:ELWxxDGT repeat protein
LVKDINTGTVNSTPNNFCKMGNNIYFSANTSTTGTEFWSTDGTTGGTMLVKDINTGTVNANPTSLCALGTNVLFAANNGTAVNGAELWISDGTTVGTTMLKDINPGAPSSNPNGLMMNSNWIYFSADNGTNGVELWKTDGTLANTTMMQDINAGAGSAGPTNFGWLGARMLFSANNGTVNNGNEPWSFCGTVPVAATTSTASLCSGMSATLTASGANTYTWSTTSTNTSIVVSPTTTSNYIVTGTDIGNCTNTATITQVVTICNGIAAHSLDASSLSVYPNPFNSNLKVELNGVSSAKIDVINALGAVVYSTKVEGSTEMNLGNLQAGIYFMKMESSAGTVTKKIIKQ